MSKTLSYKRLKTMKSDASYMNSPDQQSFETLKALAIPEILEIVFSHLDIQSKGRIAQVSWLWHDVIEQPRFWSDVKVHLFYCETKPFQYRIKPTEYLHRPGSIQRSSQSYPLLTQMVVHVKGMLTYKMVDLIVMRFRNVVSLELRCNRRNKVVKDIALARIVDGLKFLRHLDLGDFSDITDVGIAFLCGWNGVTCDGNIPALQSLCLGGNCHMTDDALKYLSVGQAAIQSLDLSCSVGFTEIGLQFLTRLKGLRILKLISCIGIKDYGMFHLAQMDNLIELDLSYTNITPYGLELFTSVNSSLTSLQLLNSWDMDDDCGPPLACLTRLTNLCLSGTDIGDSVLQCLADGAGASAIKTLNIIDCQNLTHEAIQHLVRMVNLRDLSLTVTSMGEAGLCHLANVENSKIEKLILVESHHITKASLHYLKARLPRLRKLLLR